QGERLRLDALGLLVNVGRKQPEAGVLDLELALGLGDAALAQQDRLPALGQRPADDRPFFQSVTEHDSPRAAGAMLVNPRRLPYTTTSFRALPVFTAESHDRGSLSRGWRRGTGTPRDELHFPRPRGHGQIAGRLRPGGLAATRRR